MKANQKFRNDRAEVGVGTLIVFIAMVLVAAVAAAVLINTTGNLQQRAAATGKEATQEVSSNLKVVNVIGERAADTDDIQELKLIIQLSAGALPMDLEQLVVRYSDGGATPVNYVWEAWDNDGPSTDAVFQLDWIRPTVGAPAGAAGDSVMSAGDLVQVHFTLADEIPERTDIQISLIPETGGSVAADFKTPPTYGDDLTLTLR